VDWQNARQMMINRFETSAKATSSYETWSWSPYFVFLEIPVLRSVMRSPSGAELENIFCENLKASAQTQNIILGHYLELIARDRQIDDYVMEMLGEGGKGQSIEQIKKELEWKTDEEMKAEAEKKKLPDIKKKIGQAKGQANVARINLGKTLGTLGIKSAFLRGEGPYELAFRDRVTKNFTSEAGAAFEAVINYLKSAFQVPGSRFL